MKIESMRFVEFKGQDREWILEETPFYDVNLIVGKNATGKSRLLNVIASLANMLSGPIQNIYPSGNYEVRFSADTSTYEYKLAYENKNIQSEVFTKNQKVLLARGDDGSGRIWAERLNDYIDFQSPLDQLAARVRQDAIQHSFFEELHTRGEKPPPLPVWNTPWARSPLSPYLNASNNRRRSRRSH